MMNDDARIDVNKLSFTDLNKLLEDTKAAIAHKRVEEIKVLADGFAKKLAIAGFSVREGIAALQPYLPAKETPRASRPAGDKAAKYRNPDNPNETWVGAGKQPQWFKAQLEKGTPRDSMLVR
jgi:DNA-binding protein H-NS